MFLKSLHEEERIVTNKFNVELYDLEKLRQVVFGFLPQAGNLSQPGLSQQLAIPVTKTRLKRELVTARRQVFKI